MRTLLLALCLLLPLAPAHAQQRLYSQPELDALLAPVALYPDPLLSQILAAAVYPDQVAQAADWSRRNPGVSGDDAVQMVQDQPWEPSVKALVAYPDVLARMGESPQWTVDLGNAFLGQQTQTMATVQALRQRAQASGYLRSDGEQQVYQQGPAIAVQPVYPQYMYVRYYDPLVVYGTWWWPAYRPVFWRPWAPRVVFVNHVNIVSRQSSLRELMSGRAPGTMFRNPSASRSSRAARVRKPGGSPSPRRSASRSSKALRVRSCAPRLMVSRGQSQWLHILR